jgi:hypothetical protein
VNRLYEGYEVEGVFQGLFTLFVSGDVPLLIIIKYLNETKYRQVYFGADNLSQINWETVLGLVVMKVKPIITVEVSSAIPTGLLGEVYIVLKINGLTEKQLSDALESMPDEKMQIKFDTEKCSYLIPVNRLISNQRNAILQDKELCRQA